MKFEDLQNFMTRGVAAQKAVNKILKQTEMPMEHKANYRIVLQVKDFVLIQDIGPWDHYLTITNAAERVVTDLIAGGKIQHGQRLFYLDSDKEMDEIEFNVVDGFQRFHCLNPKDEVACTCKEAWKQVEKYAKKF